MQKCRSKQQFRVLFLVLALAGCLLPWCTSGAESPMTAGALSPEVKADPPKVGYSVWIGDIPRIDSVAQTFTANFMLSLHWRDPQLRHPGPASKKYALADIWHPHLLIANEAGEIKRSLPEIAEVKPDGEVLYRQRFVGQFTQMLNLHAFPFDKGDFRIHFLMPGVSPGEIQFEPQGKAIAAGLPQGIGLSDRLSLQDWRVSSISACSEPYVVLPGFEVAGFSFGFTATRNTQHFIIKVIIPLILIVMMSWAIFWIDPTQSGSQYSIAVTAMLTLIAYRFSIDATIPILPYLTRLDTFILTGTLLIFLSLIEVMITTKLADLNRIGVARAIDWHSRWVFPLVFIGASLWILFL